MLYDPSKKSAVNSTNTSNTDFLIGYEKVLERWDRAQKQCPTNPKVELKKVSKINGTDIDFQFKIGNKSQTTSSNCSLTISGINKAIDNAKLISQKLANCETEVEFWDWYDEAILDKSTISNDVLTFGEAIAKVENYFWESRDRNGRQRVKDPDRPNYHSWKRSYDNVYGNFYKLLPSDKNVNFEDMIKVIESKEAGSKVRSDTIGAMKKLSELIEYGNFWEKLNQLDTKITKKREKPLQSIGLEDFLDLHKAIWEYGLKNKLCRRHLPSRKAWLWVFSMQVVYGFRISEVFSIQNIDKEFQTPDGVTIPALNDFKNDDMIAVVGEQTLIGTTTKTGYRLARPMIPPSHSNLIEYLGIKEGKLPDNRPKKDSNSNTKGCFFNSTARQKLQRWHAQISSQLDGKEKLTQTHALRHLANLNGMIAGLSLEQRAMSLGHSPAMNDSVYKKRKTTQTTLNALTTQTQAIPLNSAISSYKAIYGDEIDENVLRLLSTIYGTSNEKIKEYLGAFQF